MSEQVRTIEQLHNEIIAGTTTIRNVVEEYLNTIHKSTNINAILGTYENIEEYIKNAEEMLANGTVTLLTGIPFVIKDNILVKGEFATAASKILEGYRATYDATVIDKLKNAGAILLARSNMDEFAMGGSTENSAFGPTKNPIDHTRVPGGSSGGSAAAVAANMCVASLGTDTGGSIRQPAAFCGIVGLKPTYGAVSRYGAIDMGSSLDQIGPFARTVGDTEIVFKAISGRDMHDATSMDGAPDIREVKTIGVPFDFIRRDGVSADVLKNFEETIEKLKHAGYTIVDVSLPYIHYALSVYYIVMPAEVSSNLARFDGIRYGLSVPGKDSAGTFANTRGTGFGKEVRRRILLGTYILSHGYYDAYYNKALLVREKIREQLNDVFTKVDVILTPTTPTTAFKLGEKSDPLSMYMADIFTVPANIAGIPALSLPSGVDAEGLPFGLQITAPDFCEQRLFSLGKEIEKLI